MLGEVFRCLDIVYVAADGGGAGCQPQADDENTAHSLICRFRGLMGTRPTLTGLGDTGYSTGQWDKSSKRVKSQTVLPRKIRSIVLILGVNT